MSAYYNELDPFPCRVIEANIARGRLPPGHVDCRSIEVVSPDELIRANHSQFHLFAGIGGAAYACRLAGLPDNFSIGTMGFPCQDISCAGAQEGIGGARSGLFFYGAALFRVLRPRWLLLENVPNLRTAGAGKDPDGIAAIELVIAALEEIAYTVLPPVVVGADDAEAPQKRKRVWIVARANETLADTELQLGRFEQQQPVSSRKRARNELVGSGGNLEYSPRSRARQLSARSRTEGQRAPNTHGGKSQTGRRHGWR